MGYYSIFIFFMILGILFNFFLFRQEKNNRKSDKFLTSERLILFFIEILIGVIGFGATLNYANSNDRKIEKDKAITMIELAVEYTDFQVDEESAYLRMYADGDIETDIYFNSSVTNLDYYDNIRSNELIMLNVNPIAYGYFMDYLVRLNVVDERARSLTEKSEIETQMYWRCQYLKKIRDLLYICEQDMKGEISDEETVSSCEKINNFNLSTYEILCFESQ